MEDFDNDGLLDLVVTSWAPNEPMAFYRNKGDGTFEDRTKAAGLDKQMGGLYCVQTDYNNDGHMDIFIPRGSWLPASPVPATELAAEQRQRHVHRCHAPRPACWPRSTRPARPGRITTTTAFSTCSSAAEHQPCLLYRNKGDGTFEEVAARAGLRPT